MILRIELDEQVPAQKNQKRVAYINGRPVVYTAKAVKDWQRMAGFVLRTYNERFVGRVIVKYRFYCKDKRRRDLDNMIATVNDALVKAGIIEDDDWQHLTIGGAAGEIDKERPRVVIEIETAG